MHPAYFSATFGLASAASFGTADFTGGMVSKRAPVFGVLTVARTSGLAVALTLAAATHERIPSAGALLWAGAAGFIGALALPALYRALAVGKMSLAAPVTSVLCAAVPVLVAAVSEGLPHPVQICGLLLALAALWFISRPEGTLGRQGLGLALFAGVGFGTFLVCMRHATANAVYWPLATALVVSLVMAIGIMALQGESLPKLRLMPVVLVAGVLDTGGNFFFVLASQRGRLDVAAVLSSLYPAFTVLLAHLVLKERISRVQAIGMFAALIAVPLITGA
jgi:drug/metabolite transporter (DMT)-like permease